MNDRVLVGRSTLATAVGQSRLPRLRCGSPSTTLSVNALIVAVTPVGAASGQPLPVLAGAGCDVAGSGGGRCRHPSAVAPVTQLTIAVDVATVAVNIAIYANVPIDVDVSVEVPVYVHVPINVGVPVEVSIDADVSVEVPIEVCVAVEVRIDVDVAIEVRAAMKVGGAATCKVAAPTPGVGRRSEYQHQENNCAQERCYFLHDLPPVSLVYVE